VPYSRPRFKETAAALDVTAEAEALTEDAVAEAAVALALEAELVAAATYLSGSK